LHGIKEQVGINRFLLSAKKWIETTNAIGIRSSSGRYGGTFAHPDIAFHFCLWLSPTFQLYISKEFQRLKQQEAKDNKEHLDWTIKRTLAKVNYKIHADAIKTHLIPFKVQDTKFESLYYASEADLSNIALFSMTAKEWRESNPDLKGNMLIMPQQSNF
jgi:KilA-N domain